MSGKTANDVIVGIDLGTTFSLVAYADQRGPQVIRDESGEARLPSVIGVQPGSDGQPEISIGWTARARAVLNPRATVYSIKRLIGKGPAEVARELPFLTYEVVSGPRETLQVEIEGRRYSPEEISAVILRALKQRAERHFGHAVSKAVITVPAYFDDAQRQATRTAGEAAGLEIVRIINEPTAAAMAYGIGIREQAQTAHATSAESSPRGGSIALQQPKCAAGPSSTSAAGQMADHTVAVYDLGGGTFDVSVLRIESGVFEVLSTAGDTRLGGDDFDRLIIAMVAADTREHFGIEIDAPATRQALRGLAESVKVKLSAAEQATLELGLGEQRTVRRTITRSEFESAALPLVERTLRLCDQALRDAHLKPADLARIILVGGATRMPLVRERVAQHFGKPPYTALNPDEVVALGAAVQGAILAGHRTDLLLLDVIPLSLGIETLGGAMGKLILRNTTIPARATEMFTTFVDGQTAIKLKVLQGERELAEHCRALAEFELRGIPPMPAGIPKVEVEFLVDANGILSVAARELRSGVEASIQVVPSHGLTRPEIERIMQESIRFARADIDAHRRIDLLNQVEFDTQKCEQMLERLSGKLGSPDVERYRAAVAALRKFARTTENLDDLHRALDDFGRSTLPLAELGIAEVLGGAVPSTGMRG